MKRELVITVLGLAVISMFAACQSPELFHSLENSNWKIPDWNNKNKDKDAIAEARSWYNLNRDEVSFIATRSDGYRLFGDMEPYWKQTYTRKTNEFTSVESGLKTSEGIFIVSPDCQAKYKETGDKRYLITMTRLIILIYTINFSLSGQTSVLHRVTDPKVEQWERGDSVGYADAKGNMVIPFGKYRYCYNEEFDKIAFVALQDRSGMYAIDRKENVLFEVFMSDTEPDLVQEGVFRIKKGNKIGFANMEGNIILPPQFDGAWPFSDGFSGICIGGTFKKDGDYTILVGGKWKFIDKSGKPINAEEYDDLRPFRNGVASVEKNGKWGRINQKGEIVVPIKYTFDKIPR